MLNLALTIALTLLNLMVTVSGNPNPTNPTYPTNPTNPTNPTTKYRCEFVTLFCIYALIFCGIPNIGKFRTPDSNSSQKKAGLRLQAQNQTPTLTLELNAHTSAYIHKEKYKLPKTVIRLST